MNQATNADTRAADDIPQAFLVSLVRLTRTRTADGDYTEVDAPLLTNVTGYGYRRNYKRARTEDPQGVITGEYQIILSLPGQAAGAVQIGDFALMPACDLTDGVAQRALVQQVRAYPTGLQCDLEIGAQQQDAV